MPKTKVQVHPVNETTPVEKRIYLALMRDDLKEYSAALQQRDSERRAKAAARWGSKRKTITRKTSK